ncbi:MAG TPA: toprim domain-containing protein [Ohtaekwangia sp.]|nr:toprim domain-containing protein [Ohtaekwangia sp.]
MALSYSDAKRIAITDYLSRLGFEPARVRGNDYWYRSPFRSERDASFKVNVKLNLWYDHGEGVGGTLLDLGQRLHSCTIKEFVSRLDDGKFLRDFTPRRSNSEPAENRVEILSTGPLLDEGLLNYISQRKIDTKLAQASCQEVDFRIAQRNYKAVGFQNLSGGYELRNSWFKGSSSPKDITLIETGAKSLIVTEGFFDYLSLQQLNDSQVQKELAASDKLILNSISFIRKSLPMIKNYPIKLLFLDNDQAADKAKAFLHASNIDFIDRSGLYAKHKDVNELLTRSSLDHATSNRKRSKRL